MGSARGPRPHLWCTGTDFQRHRRYLVYVQHRNQAQHRGEAYDLTFDQYLEIWGDLWEQRGRHRGAWQMIRQDPEQGWWLGNITLSQRERGRFRKLK